MAISATSGPVSNLDYQSLISQLVGLRTQPLNKLSADKKSLEKTYSAYTALGSKVGDLKSAAEALKKTESFNVFSASSTDSSIFSASASSTASAGTYSVKVTTLAKAHKIAADGYAAETSTIAAGAGSFKFTVGSGAEQSIAVDGTTTLTGIKDSINALNAGVKAVILNDGSGPTPYRLILTSDTTGSANAVNITQNDTTLLFSTTLQTADDASFSIDNLNFTRSSNSVSDLITGVTINLNSADPLQTETLTIARDTASIEKKVSAFLSKYNDVVNYIKANNRYDKETKVGGVFFGDSVARSIWEDLRRTISSAASGLPDTMNRLSHVGVKSDTEGMLSIDSSKLSSALSESFDDVVNLFVEGTATNGFGKLVYDLTNSMTDFVDGRITGRQKGITKNIENIKSSITRTESQVAKYEESLRAQFLALETAIVGIRAQGNFLASLTGGGK